jgi:hypothetical protein
MAAMSTTRELWVLILTMDAGLLGWLALTDALFAAGIAILVVRRAPWWRVGVTALMVWGGLLLTSLALFALVLERPVVGWEWITLP